MECFLSIKRNKIMKRNKFKATIGTQILLLILLVSIPITIGMGQNQQLTDLLRKAGEAGIELANLDLLQTRANDYGMGEEELFYMIEPAMILAKKNLPNDAIFQKALEGITKKVPAERIHPVLDDLRRNTEEVVTIVDPWLDREEVAKMVRRAGEEKQMSKQRFRNEMIKYGSRALSRDVSRENLQSLLDEVGQDRILQHSAPISIMAAVSILPDLPIPDTTEHPVNSKAILVHALQNGFGATDFQRLPGAISVAQKRGEMSAATVMEGVSQQLRGQVPASQILQNLYDGKSNSLQ